LYTCSAKAILTAIAAVVVAAGYSISRYYIVKSISSILVYLTY
jgi:hypothetical protein